MINALYAEKADGLAFIFFFLTLEGNLQVPNIIAKDMGWICSFVKEKSLDNELDGIAPRTFTRKTTISQLLN